MNARSRQARPTQVPSRAIRAPIIIQEDITEVETNEVIPTETEEPPIILWAFDALLPSTDIYGVAISPFAAPDDFAARLRHNGIPGHVQKTRSVEMSDFKPMDEDEAERIRILRDEESKMDREKGIYKPFRIFVEKSFSPIIGQVDAFGIPIPSPSFRDIPWSTTHERLIRNVTE